MSEKRIRPRALTLTLPDRKQPSLLLGERRYLLRNFSEEGLGLWMPTPPPFDVHRGARVKGDVEIGQDIYPVQLEVMHYAENIIGLHITQASEELTRIFHELLEPSIYASQLKPHPKSGQEDSENGFHRIWYHGPGHSELLIWSNGPKGLIRQLQVCWLGRWVFRELLQDVRTGALREGDPNLGGQRFAPEHLLIRHPEPDSSLMRDAAQFLSALPKELSGHLLWQFLETGEQIFLPGGLAPTKAA